MGQSSPPRAGLVVGATIPLAFPLAVAPDVARGCDESGWKSIPGPCG